MRLDPLCKKVEQSNAANKDKFESSKLEFKIFNQGGAL